MTDIYEVDAGLRRAMYYAMSLRDILRTTRLSYEFFDSLDEFNILYIRKWFEQTLENQMGMLTEIEQYNYFLFQDYLEESLYADYISNYKRSA